MHRDSRFPHSDGVSPRDPSSLQSPKTMFIRTLVHKVSQIVEPIACRVLPRRVSTCKPAAQRPGCPAPNQSRRRRRPSRHSSRAVGAGGLLSMALVGWAAAMTCTAELTREKKGDRDEMSIGAPGVSDSLPGRPTERGFCSPRTWSTRARRLKGLDGPGTAGCRLRASVQSSRHWGFVPTDPSPMAIPTSFGCPAHGIEDLG